MNKKIYITSYFIFILLITFTHVTKALLDNMPQDERGVSSPTTSGSESKLATTTEPTSGSGNPEIDTIRIKKNRVAGKSPRKLKRIRSMADLPQNEHERKLIEDEIKKVPQSTIGAPKITSQPPIEEAPKLGEVANIYLGDYMEPWKGLPDETISLNIGTDKKGGDLKELLHILEQNLRVNFITDDAVEPTKASPDMVDIAGHSITFKSNTPLTLKQLWQIGVTFLEMSGFSVTPSNQPRTYRVTSIKAANKEPLPTFIGTDVDLLPNTDEKIRYIYFAENIDLKTAQEIVLALQSPSAATQPLTVPQLRAIMMTDKASSIRGILQVFQELDQVSMPETLAIIRLKHTDADKVAQLYNQLVGKGADQPYNPFAPQRKPTTTQYFTQSTRVFAEPRTNSLIVLGTRDNIKKFEEFIFNYIDKTLDLPFSPLHIHQLRYISADDVSKILMDVIQKFNTDAANSNAANFGGVRDGNKFFRPTVRITPEPFSNRLIINADYEEYLKLREILERLDVEQPQVAIKVLILNVDLTNAAQLGTQIRNSLACCDKTGGTTSLLGPNVNFQSAQLGPFITNPPIGSNVPDVNIVNGGLRLLGNLINLVNPTLTNNVNIFPTGTTLVTLGKDIFGFWGLLSVLQSLTRVSIIANPFLVTTHKYQAEIKVGETRRVVSAIVEGTRAVEANDDLSANLLVRVTPQISYDDMITLNIYVEIGQFTSAVTADRLIRKVSTEALVANREVVALGGLIRDRTIENETGVPLLKDIPLIGWLFKNKTKEITRSSLLILISPEIIKPHEPSVAQKFTYEKITAAKRTLYRMERKTEQRDPLNRWIFKDNIAKESSIIDNFTSMQQRYVDETRKHVEPVLALNDAPKNETKGLLDLIKPKEIEKEIIA